MTQREKLRKLKKLLRHADLASVRQGVDLARDLGDPGVYAKLLEGSRLDEGRPVFGPSFVGNKSTRDNLRYAWLALVGSAPKEVRRHESLHEPTLLDLSDIRLPAWPDTTPALNRVQTLVLSRCWLDALPLFIGGLTELKTLRLDRNRIEQLPEELALDHLEALELAHNRLTRFVSSVPTLRSLDLRDNPITSLAIGGAVHLRTLLLRNARLETLPPEVGQLTSLRTLEATRCGLEFLPPELGSLAALEALDLRDNELERLPATVGEMRSLETLDLTNNHLVQLPTELGQLPRLRRLRASFNRLTQVPESLGGASGLRLIALGSNPLARVPSSIGALGGLRQLDLSGAELVELELEGLRALRRLDVGRNELAALDLTPCPELEILLAASNALSNVAGLAQLTRLEELDLSSNRLRELPQRLAQLPKLRSLRISGNGLEALPDGPYPALQELDASDNHLRELPRLAQHLGLHRLDLSGNELLAVTAESLPRRVRELRLAGCNLQTLSGDLAALPLRSLDLSGNALVTVPDSLLAIASLQELNLQDNPLNEATRERLRSVTGVRLLL